MSNPDTSESISEQLNYLKSLFERRLMDDKVKSRAFDELYAQLEFAKSGLTDQFFLPVVKEVLGVCDRIEREADSNPVLFSIVDELMEVLRRRGLEDINCVGGFDPSVHEGTGVVEVDDRSSDRQVMSTQRAGYRLGSRLVRPARVVIGRYTPPHDSRSLGSESVKADGADASVPDWPVITDE